ncbi:hypothetical protein H6G41_00465 [Tolypothrix sp. FACHB-123]|uniref:hypothetical protein n=1 Tax=Tolypothrix sp. FACHB-123 TaxID=2692868 RepID=UPI001684E511|nr:hypothetical protein [Tolypothrix sp. FACHB-123]MBD2353107.1 hypothetical protein [Tolypothrix sp. FACHB-123]
MTKILTSGFKILIGSEDFSPKIRTEVITTKFIIIVGDKLSAADIVIGGVLLWALKLGMLKENDPLDRYIKHLMERPALMRADENLYTR